MENQEPLVARRYHQKTKHSLASIQSNRHYLDWNNQPNVYKTYRDVKGIPLPADLPQSDQPTFKVLQDMIEDGKGEAIPDLHRLAYILYYAAGVTKKLQYSGGEIEFRAAAAAGALYPIEVYAICGDLPGLQAGVYQFGPRDFSLRVLRRGDFREHLANATGWYPEVVQAPLILVFTAITWRSAWKYQARSYRYHFWDAGMILANCLAASQALDMPAQTVLGFVDQEVNRLVGIDGEFEKSLALVPVGRTMAEPGPSPVVSELDLEIEPLSPDMRAYPIIDEMNRASSLESSQAVRDWRERTSKWKEPEIQISADRLFDLPTFDPQQEAGKGLEETIVKRGSSRRFRRQPLPAGELSAILGAAAAGFQRDWTENRTRFLNRMFLNIHAIDELPSGSYLYLPETHELTLLQEGDFRSHSAYLCLGQELGGDASASVFFLSDLEAVYRRFGDRGYRAAQLEAGILGGKMYLAAYALGRGASGLTFFDDDVVNFFSPEAAGMEAIFVTTLGLPASSGRSRGKMVYLGPGSR